jgi:hypothetical protein
MPNPVFSDVHIQAALTQISVAYMQDQSNYIADKVFANVPVVHQADKYYIFRKGDFLKDQMQARADGTESAGGGFNLDTGSYSATVFAFHKDVGDQVRRNADPQIDMDVVTTKFVTQTLLIGRDRSFMAKYMVTGVWATDCVGTPGGTPGSTTPPLWSDDTNGDPFTDLAVGQTTVLQATGFLPNILVIGWAVFQALKKHPLVIDRIKYTNPAFAGTVNEQLLAQCFDVDEVLVSKAVYNNVIESAVAGGATPSMNFVMSNSALLCYRNPAPQLMAPSAGYIFPWQGFSGLNNNGIRIMSIPMPWLGANTIRIEGEMSYDMQVIGKDLGYFFSGIA